MYVKSQWVAAVLMLAAFAVLADDALAHYSPKLGRWLTRDPIAEPGSVNLTCYTHNSPIVRFDSLGRSDQEAKPPSTQPSGGWSWELVSGPRFIDGRGPSYDITIAHVPPNVPAGATQVWQVVRCLVVQLNKTCQLAVSSRDIVDILGITGPDRLEDELGYRYRGSDMCFVLESCVHTIGFDDGKSNYADQGNVHVSAADASRLLNSMVGPIGRFVTNYTFVKKANCCSCAEHLLEWADVPDGESLWISSVGHWSSWQ